MGLAHLKLKAGLLAAETQEPLYVRCGKVGDYVSIRPWRPDWWPAAWGSEAGLTPEAGGAGEGSLGEGAGAAVAMA